MLLKTVTLMFCSGFLFCFVSLLSFPFQLALLGPFESTLIMKLNHNFVS